MPAHRKRSKTATSPPLAFAGPRGICVCGHTGNGPNSDHADDNLRTSDTVQGTGVCHAPDCQCSRFQMARRTPEWQRYLDDALNVVTLCDPQPP